MDLSRYGAVLGTRDLKRDLTIVGYIIVAIEVLLFIIHGQVGFLITAMGFLAFMLLVTNAGGLRSHVPVFEDPRPRVRRGAYAGLLVGTLLLASGHVNLLIIAVGLLAFTLLVTNADGLRCRVPVFEDPRPLVRRGAYAGLLVGTFVLAGLVGPHGGFSGAPGVQQQGDLHICAFDHYDTANHQCLQDDAQMGLADESQTYLVVSNKAVDVAVEQQDGTGNWVKSTSLVDECEQNGGTSTTCEGGMVLALLDIAQNNPPAFWFTLDKLKNWSPNINTSYRFYAVDSNGNEIGSAIIQID